MEKFIPSTSGSKKQLNIFDALTASLTNNLNLFFIVLIIMLAGKYKTYCYRFILVIRLEMQSFCLRKKQKCVVSKYSFK